MSTTRGFVSQILWLSVIAATGVLAGKGFPAPSRPRTGPDAAGGSFVLPQTRLDSIHMLAWRPDGRVLATDAGKPPAPPALFWALTGEAVRAEPARGVVLAADPNAVNPMRTRELVWSPGGKSLVVRSDQQVPTPVVGFFEDKSAISLWTFPSAFAPPGPGMALPDAGGPVRWSPSGDLLATGADGGQGGLWAADGRRRSPLEGIAGAVAWSPNGATLATGSEGNGILLWDAASGKQRSRLPAAEGRMDKLAWSPKANRLACSTLWDAAQLWNVETGTLLANLSGHQGLLTTLSWSPDGGSLVTATAVRQGRTPDTFAILWDGHTGERRATLAGHGAQVWAVAWRPDGHLLATIAGAYLVFGNHGGSLPVPEGDSSTILWDARTGERRATLKGDGPVLEVAWSPDGQVLATVTRTGTMTLWDPVLAKARGSRRLPMPVDAIAWRPDGRFLAAAAGGAVHLCDARGRPRLTLHSLNRGKDWFAATPDGYCAGSEGALQAVRCRHGGKVWPMEKFRREIERPTIVGRALSG